MEEKIWLDVDIIFSVTQSKQILQRLTSTGFCVKGVLGKWEHLLYPNLKPFLDVKKQLLLPLVGAHQNILQLYPKRYS